MSVAQGKSNCSRGRWIKWGTSLCLLTLGFTKSATTFADLVGLERVATSLSSPVYVTHAPGDRDRLFILEKGGNIRTLNIGTGMVAAQPFLNISDTDPAGEGGLLGLAFHPNYTVNGKYYVYVTVDNDEMTIDGVVSPFSSHVREYTDPAIATAPMREIISWVQPRSNHNGGWIGFSPNDNYLYITSGDGGKQGDPDNNAQTLFENNPGQTFPGEPLGKILRIDVDTDGFPADATRNYAIPSSNPYASNPSATGEIWADGLRNPWRASFDRLTGDFWIGDVGQGLREEIDFQPASSGGGEDYGWNRREGFDDFLGGAAPPEEVLPVYAYNHGSGAFQGDSIVGGYVYRGPDPQLQGTYYFGNTVDVPRIWSFDPNDPGDTVEQLLGSLPINLGSVNTPVAFGEDAVGNLYVVDLDGDIFRFVTDAFVPGDFDADGDVDAADLPVWEAGYGMASGAEALDGDADGDGDVDGRDFLQWQINRGKNSMTYVPPLSALATTPEPSSILLASLGLAVCGVTRRCRARCGG
jgi:hypothetical protein